MTRCDPKYKHYLYDLGNLLKTRALESRDERNSASKDSPDYRFEAGRLIAFNEVISILQQQAEGFGIPLNELQLEDIVPDRDLI